jgi:hypothetical protein
MQHIGDLAKQIEAKAEWARLAHEVDGLIPHKRVTSFAIRTRIERMRAISPEWTDAYVAQVRREHGVAA